MRNVLSYVISVLLICICTFVSAEQPMSLPNAEIVQPLVNKLVSSKLSKTAPILEELSDAGGEEILPLFNTMLAGELYFQKSNKALFQIKKQTDSSFTATPLFVANEEIIENINKKQFKKIKINNRLRGKLRELIARTQLNSNDINTRKNAIQVMMGEMSTSQKALLESQLDREEKDTVKTLLNTAIAMYDLSADNSQEARLAAIDTLSGSLNPDVRNELSKLTAVDDTGKPIENDTAIYEAALLAIDSIQGKIRFYGFLEQLFFGLSLGSVLLLAAIGLSITFGVMGVINMAHGEMMMLGAYTTYVVQQLMPDHIGLSIWVAIPSAFFVSGIVGIAIERGVIQFLKGRPLETLLATFGISLILQQAVRSIFSPLNRQVASPDWLSGSIAINEVFSITYNRLYIFLFALIVFFALQLVLKRSRLGLNVRAVSQNRSMAKAMGIKTEWVDATTFGLGSGIAGIAGVALSQLTNVGPNLGQAYIIDSFMVVVFGGVGNLLGTLVAGFTLGITSKFLEPITGAVLANIIILVFIILFIQRRPQGLFPQKGRAAND